MFGDNQFTSTLSVNFHFPRIPRRTYKKRVASLEKAQLERLRTAQRAWITFRDAQCRYEAGVYEGGSLTSSPTLALRVTGGGFPLLGDSCSRSTGFLLHRAA
ncbi:hypothetical protein KAM472_41750 [Aeromonas caviae]|nr:hypothetical protein KAM462_41520 [Aeromonas caviae]GKR12680.1 hypothetical protein KAM465_42570 [Aeromonas caviae]GKR16953.1 hypothetical protein KAM466_42710 [Aeromonas caviae]GKR25539.1 hypothetical protein KAM468_42790 [Aeromonas caviae]GKR29924.1 hypothetical protein KAM469_43830 [Aeromonas caviae]